MSLKYEKLVKRRESLMNQFELGELPRMFYLQQMGAISLKADKAARRTVVDVEGDGELAQVAPVEVPVEAAIATPLSDDGSDSHDSLSETRPVVVDSEGSFSDQDDPFAFDPVLQGRKKKTAEAQKKTAEGPNKNGRKQLCLICKRGFQLRRLPPLHVICSGCQVMVHKRCIKQSSTRFICTKCKPSTSDSMSGTLPSSPVATAASTSCTIPSSRSLPASDKSVLTSSCCEEMLLSEEVEVPCLPTYLDYNTKFDERMNNLGFERSPTQRNTKGDGNCGIYALLDQLNLPKNEPNPMFVREDDFFAR